MKALRCRLIGARPACLPDHGTVLANLYGKQGNSSRIGRVPRVRRSSTCRRAIDRNPSSMGSARWIVRVSNKR
jgi:hypothetical protein